MEKSVKRLEAGRVAERQWHKEQSGIGLDQWPATYDLLLQNLPEQPDSSHTKALYVKIPLNAGRVYQHNPWLVSLRILLRYGCRTRLIHVYSAPTGGELLSRYMALYGPPETTNLARRSLYALYDSMLPADVDEVTSVLKSSGARQVMSAWPDLPIETNVPLSELEMPAEMNILSFAVYVKQLIATKPSRLNTKDSERQMGGRSRTEYVQHVDKVAQELVALFKTYSFRSSWSLYAILCALRYLGKHRIIPAQREIFEQLQHAKAVRSSEVYAAMLEASANAQDIRTFHHILQLMVADGLAPGWQVWNQFVRLVRYYDMKTAHAIIDTMRNKGFLASAAARVQVAETMCAVDYQSWNDAHQRSEDFIEHYDKLWDGADWLTSSSIHSILTYHARRGQFEEAKTMLTRYTNQHGVHKISHLELLLAWTRKHGRLQTAIELVESFQLANPSLVLNQKVHESLFLLAMARQRLNVACAVWQSAFAHGYVSHKMQRTLSESLYAAKLHKAQSDAPGAPSGQENQEKDTSAQLEKSDDRSSASADSKQAFQSLAAVTILKITASNIRQQVERGAYPTIRIEKTNLKVRKNPWRQVQLMRRMLASASRSNPTQPLHRLLREAWRRDVDNARRKRTPAWQEVIRVPLEPLTVKGKQQLSEQPARDGMTGNAWAGDSATSLQDFDIDRRWFHS